MTSMLNKFVNDERRRWAVLVVVCFGQFMIVLDTTIVNVALPALKTDLGFSDSFPLTWVVNAYLIAFGSFLLLAGRLSDIFGSRRVFITGLSVFTLASIVCGMAVSPAMLIAARFVQGIGGALTAAVVLAILVSEFPGLQDRRRAMGVFAFIAPAGAGTGLLAGGVLTQSISWHWIFLVDVPIGIAVLVAARALVEHRPPAAGGVRLDVPGAVLITAGSMALVAGIVGAADHGWGAPQTLIPAAVAAVLISLFVRVESRSSHALVPPAILRVRSLMTSSLIRGTLVTGMYGMFFLGALYLEQTRGFDAVQIGLAFLPMPIGIGFMSLFVTGRLVGRFGPGRTLAGGMTVVLGGMALLATVGETTAYFPTFGVGIALLGLGMGAAFAPLLELSMADVPADDVGLASGIIQMSMQLAAALGLAVLSTLAAGDSPAAGLSLAMTVSAVAVAAALLLAIAEIRRSREQADVVPLEREEDLQAIAA